MLVNLQSARKMKKKCRRATQFVGMVRKNKERNAMIRTKVHSMDALLLALKKMVGIVIILSKILLRNVSKRIHVEMASLTQTMENHVMMATRTTSMDVWRIVR